VIFLRHQKAGALSKNVVPCDVIISLAANYFLWYFSIYAFMEEWGKGCFVTRLRIL
jgi:hypothetical protein